MDEWKPPVENAHDVSSRDWTSCSRRLGATPGCAAGPHVPQIVLSTLLWVRVIAVVNSNELPVVKSSTGLRRLRDAALIPPTSSERSGTLQTTASKRKADSSTTAEVRVVYRRRHWSTSPR